MPDPMIDTHIHLLEPDRFTYEWTNDFPALSGRFDLSDYENASRSSGIQAGVFMEVDCAESAEEARYFCSLAEKPGALIQAVVAAARPESPGFEKSLEAMAHPRLTGIRRVLHTQPDELSQAALFRENVNRLGGLGLTFDLCVLQRQLPLALDLVRACPQTTFILDHCGVPAIADNNAPTGADFLAWKKSILAIAAEPHVNGKISGITTYSPTPLRNAQGLQPYIDTMLEAFRPDRLVWGGDWPVVNLGDGLEAWSTITLELLSRLTESERTQILTDNAKRIYRIP
jgi:predicted TIM-barrel fold metal-dependent hydrolase